MSANKRFREFGGRSNGGEKRRHGDDSNGSKEPLHTLWIGDLDAWEDEVYLATLLPTVLPASCPAAAVKIVRDNATGASQGFGFLDFGTPEIAQQALDILRAKQRPGRFKRFKVCWAAANTHNRNTTFCNPEESFLVRMENPFSSGGARVSDSAVCNYLQTAGYKSIVAVHLLGDNSFLARFLDAAEAHTVSQFACSTKALAAAQMAAAAGVSPVQTSAVSPATAAASQASGYYTQTVVAPSALSAAQAEQVCVYGESGITGVGATANAVPNYEYAYSQASGAAAAAYSQSTAAATPIAGGGSYGFPGSMTGLNYTAPSYQCEGTTSGAAAGAPGGSAIAGGSTSAAGSGATTAMVSASWIQQLAADIAQSLSSFSTPQQQQLQQLSHPASVGSGASAATAPPVAPAQTTAQFPTPACASSNVAAPVMPSGPATLGSNLHRATVPSRGAGAEFLVTAAPAASATCVMRGVAVPDGLCTASGDSLFPDLSSLLAASLGSRNPLQQLTGIGGAGIFGLAM